MRRQLKLRTKWFAYVPLTVILLPFILWITIANIHDWNLDATKAVGFMCGILLFIYAGLASFKVVVQDELLCVRNYYIWHRIPLSEIERAHIKVGYEGPMGPPIRIKIEPRQGSRYKPFWIPIVPYKPEQLRKLYEILGVKSKRTRLFSREKV